MCGVFGMIGRDPVGESILQGLNHLQHRGQDGAGLFTYNPDNRKHYLRKERGTVNQVFTHEQFPLPLASWGIGHLRYATIGNGQLQDLQPHVVHKQGHTVAMVHNGNVVNYNQLKELLQERGTELQTTCDTEAILHIFADALPKGTCDFEDICHSVDLFFNQVFGAYSILGIITGVGFFAFRDPWGFRPLIYGIDQRHGMHYFSSETGPLRYFHAEELHDVAPGELVFIDHNHNVFRRRLKKIAHTHCSFEYNYFAKSNAVIENQEVYQIRRKLGIALAKKVANSQIKVDIVVPIPDTARPSALALAHHLHIPIEEGLVKQDHIGRTFILPTQAIRKKAVCAKLSTVASVFKNKNVLLVDDSIVRGTVSKHAVHLARDAGANKVYLASTYPPVRHPCFYGIHFPEQEELMAWNKNLDDIAKSIDADGVIYNDIEDIETAIGLNDLCVSCITGKYPIAKESCS